MEKRDSPRKEVYRSVAEFEEKFFPTYHERRLSQKRRDEPSNFGTGLATELLENIRQRLAK